MCARLSHAVEMFSLEPWPLKVLSLLRFVELPISKRQRCLESVLDLAPVPPAGRPFYVVEPMLLGELANLVFGKIKLEARIAKPQEAGLPDL